MNEQTKSQVTNSFTSSYANYHARVSRETWKRLRRYNTAYPCGSTCVDNIYYCSSHIYSAKILRRDARQSARVFCRVCMVRLSRTEYKLGTALTVLAAPLPPRLWYYDFHVIQYVCVYIRLSRILGIPILCSAFCILRRSIECVEHIYIAAGSERKKQEGRKEPSIFQYSSLFQ